VGTAFFHKEPKLGNSC